MTAADVGTQERKFKVLSIAIKRNAGCRAMIEGVCRADAPLAEQRAKQAHVAARRSAPFSCNPTYTA